MNNYSDFIHRARETGRAIAVERGCVTIDDIRREIPHPEGMPDSVYGSIFRSGFKCMGFTKSTREEAHGRIITVWRLA